MKGFLILITNTTEYINSNIDKIFTSNNKAVIELPFFPIKNVVPFPSMIVVVPSPSQRDIATASYALKHSTPVYLVCDESNDALEDIDESNLAAETYGVIAVVKQVILPKQSLASITFDCICRAIPKSLPVENKLYSTITAEPVYETPYDMIMGVKALASIRTLKRLFYRYGEHVHNLDEKILAGSEKIEDGGILSDYIAQYSYLSNDSKLQILSETNPVKRVELLSEILMSEIEILEFQEQISAKLQRKLMGDQKEHFIKEQINILRSEINDSSDETAAIYENKINELKASDDIKAQLMIEADRLWNIPESSQEFSVITTYLDTCLALPWGEYSDENIDINKAEKILEADHYGLKKVKERILETLAVKKLTDKNNGHILCLVGPPGIGKTSIATSVAQSCGRKFERISLGGVHDEAEIRGHRRTYLASMPGRIITALMHAKTSNPVILLDEVDKLGNDYKGDPASALLEVLDPEQNKYFKDHYVDLPFDLSKVFFIATANVKENIPEPLLDRMDTIELTSYTQTEKFQIAKRHLIPKQIKNHGLTAKNVKISDDAINEMIKYYTREAGVRTLEKCINSTLRKVSKLIVSEGIPKKKTITAKNLEFYLGPRRFKEDVVDKIDSIGVVNGLAYTTVGGEILPIEVNVMEGTGKIELTGSLGKVMKESANAAVSYIRSNAEKLNIDPYFYKNKDVHFHFPEGAIPKDGPSAGIGIATALISQLSGKKVHGDVAMTGEITLRGKVLPIGGLREKTMAAYKAGMKIVIVPDENFSDIKEIEEEVRNAIKFVYATDMEKVLSVALCK